MTFINGKTEENSRRLNDGFSKDEPLGLGTFRGNSRINGLRESGFASHDCSRQNSIGTDGLERDTTAGKMLQRLKLIESKYTDYVSNHQKQLEAQLTGSKAHEAELKQEIAALEKELYDLASQQSNDTH